MSSQEHLFLPELLDSWRLPSDFPGSITERVRHFMEDAINSRVERRGYSIFISTNSLEAFAEKSGRFYLEDILGVDPDRYDEELFRVAEQVGQDLGDVSRITPDDLDEWKAARGIE